MQLAPIVARRPHWKPRFGRTRLIPDHPINRDLKTLLLLNEGAASIAHDLSPQGNHFTLNSMEPADWVTRGVNIDGSPEYLSISSAVVTAYPFTVCCWFEADDVTTATTLFSVNDSSSANTQAAIMIGQAGGDPVSVMVRTGGGFAQANTTTSPAVNKHHFAVGVFESNTSRLAYLDAGGLGTNSSARAVGSYDTTEIGRLGDSSPGAHFNGRIEQIRIVNRVLAAEVVQQLNYDEHIGLEEDLVRKYWFAPAAAAVAISPPVSAQVI